jgi:outer membrane protein assembly factor BamB
MKKHHLFCWSLLFLIIVNSAVIFASDPESIYFWKFSCGPIHSKPLIRDSIAYFGSNDKNLYAVNMKNGKEIWHYLADSINSFPALKDSIVVFEARNKLYALHAKTGRFLWSYTTDANADLLIGFTDYHHSSPVIQDSLVIFCDQSGYINGVDLHTGKLKYQFLTDGHNAIRGTPVVKDSIVYAGDWIGNIYAVSLKDSIQIWKHVMQNIRPFYGAVVSEMVIRDNILYFGSQHDVFSPLDITTGDTVWTFVDERATYLPPTPVFYDNKIIIGTTINADQIMCFENNSNHKKLWSFNGSDIFFTTPVIKDSVLIMNSCNFDHKTAYYYFINCNNGTLVQQMQFNNAGPSIPVIYGSTLLIGTNDGLYAADYNAILVGSGSHLICSTENIEMSCKVKTGNKLLNLKITNDGNVCDSITIDFSVQEDPEDAGFSVPVPKKILGINNLATNFIINTNNLSVGEYHVTINIYSRNEPDLVFTKNLKVTIYDPKTNINLVGSDQALEIYPNPASESIIFNFQLTNPSDINLKIYSLKGELMMSKIILNANGKLEFEWNLTDEKNVKCPKGEYICMIQYDGKINSKKLVIY